MTPEIMLIHGWDPARYNSAVPAQDIVDNSDIGWNKSPDFINLLGKQFNLKYCNLPGFCGIPEPNKLFYSLEDFSKYVNNWKEQNCPSAKLIISYSFGGAVSLSYKHKYGDKTPLILISPAIKRKETFKSQIAHLAKNIFPLPISNVIKGLYQSLASKYYREGSPFLRATYDVVVRQDLSYLLKDIPKNEALLIFGENDDETPWNLVEKQVLHTGLNYKIIANGKHSIIKSHPQITVEEIINFSQRLKSNEI